MLQRDGNCVPFTPPNSASCSSMCKPDTCGLNKGSWGCGECADKEIVAQGLRTCGPAECPTNFYAKGDKCERCHANCIE